MSRCRRSLALPAGWSGRWRISSRPFPLFGAVVLIAHVVRHDWITVWVAQLFFWKRGVYVPVYVLGVPLLRSLV
jgi:uncharacterized MAPEG superfamily protein